MGNDNEKDDQGRARTQLQVIEGGRLGDPPTTRRRAKLPTLTEIKATLDTSAFLALDKNDMQAAAMAIGLMLAHLEQGEPLAKVLATSEKHAKAAGRLKAHQAVVAILASAVKHGMLPTTPSDLAWVDQPTQPEATDPVARLTQIIDEHGITSNNPQLDTAFVEAGFPHPLELAKWLRAHQLTVQEAMACLVVMSNLCKHALSVPGGEGKGWAQAIEDETDRVLVCTCGQCENALRVCITYLREQGYLTPRTLH